MARLQEALLARVEKFADRTLDVADALERKVSRSRLVEQIAAAGTSVGANLFEADEALSRADFCRCLGICVKELNECRFWFRLIGRRSWIPAKRLQPLESECDELRRVLGTMISRTRAVSRSKAKH
jgi:four helix bundle protein